MKTAIEPGVQGLHESTEALSPSCFIKRFDEITIADVPSVGGVFSVNDAPSFLAWGKDPGIDLGASTALRARSQVKTASLCDMFRELAPSDYPKFVHWKYKTLMNFIALKMLLGDRAKYLGIIIGLTLASFLVAWPSAIFSGVMSRTFSFVTDVGLPDIWVVDPQVQYIDDIKPLRDTEVLRVRGTEGVQWAIGLYKGMLRARMDNGAFQSCSVIGLDDETLTGGPAQMVRGKLADLRQADSIIVDEAGAKGKLAQRDATGKRVPLQVGDTLELNDHRCVVVGICHVTTTFQNVPVIYTTYSHATTIAPQERKLLSFVIAKVKDDSNVALVCARIRGNTGLSAYTPKEFKRLTFWYFLKYTGLPFNFLTVVSLGFIVGVAISGMTFYNYTLDNLRYFGTLKAMGTDNRKLLQMISLEAAVVGAIGYGLGIGAASAWGGLLSGRTQIAFLLTWPLLLTSAAAVVIICIGAAIISIRKVIQLEPAMVFRS